jgi:hypothetical protein
METSTLKTIVTVLFGVCAVWVLIIFIRREFHNLGRVILVILLLGGAYYFLQKTTLERVTVAAIRHQLFPAKAQDWEYSVEESQWRGESFTIYIFTDLGPRLELKLSRDTKSLDIVDIDPVNVALRYLGLPPVKTGTRELSSITGNVADANSYRWDDYPYAPLIIERGTCHTKSEVETYHCIATLRFQSK